MYELRNYEQGCALVRRTLRPARGDCSERQAQAISGQLQAGTGVAVAVEADRPDGEGDDAGDKNGSADGCHIDLAKAFTTLEAARVRVSPGAVRKPHRRSAGDDAGGRAVVAADRWR